MLHKNSYIFIIFLFTGCYSAFSQLEYSCLEKNKEINIDDTSKLFFNVYNNNFVKNYEYFGDIVEGYTLLGFNLTPSFDYIVSSRIRIRAGANFLSYYSRENELNASLLLSFQYKVFPNFNFVLGNIYGTKNHRLIEPLFNSERYLNNRTENGIQFLWKSKRFFADLWLDWEQQILYGDPFQEKFNVGLSSEFCLLKRNSYKLSVPFQNLIRHEGGQINSNSDVPLTTIFNNGTGLALKKVFNNSFIDSLNISSFIVNYQDLSPKKRKMYIDGVGSFSKVSFYKKGILFSLGYWYGKQYIAPIGNPIFESYSRTRFFVEEPIRQLVFGKLNYEKCIYKGIRLGAEFETFYSTQGGKIDYTWSLQMIFDNSFFLKKL